MELQANLLSLVLSVLSLSLYTFLSPYLYHFIFHRSKGDRHSGHPWTHPRPADAHGENSRAVWVLPRLRRWRGTRHLESSAPVSRHSDGEIWNYCGTTAPLVVIGGTSGGMSVWSWRVHFINKFKALCPVHLWYDELRLVLGETCLEFVSVMNSWWQTETGTLLQI